MGGGGGGFASVPFMCFDKCSRHRRAVGLRVARFDQYQRAPYVGRLLVFLLLRRFVFRLEAFCLEGSLFAVAFSCFGRAELVGGPFTSRDQVLPPLMYSVLAAVDISESVWCGGGRSRR